MLTNVNLLFVYYASFDDGKIETTHPLEAYCIFKWAIRSAKIIWQHQRYIFRNVIYLLSIFLAWIFFSPDVTSKGVLFMFCGPSTLSNGPRWDIHIWHQDITYCAENQEITFFSIFIIEEVHFLWRPDAIYSKVLWEECA